MTKSAGEQKEKPAIQWHFDGEYIMNGGLLNGGESL